MVSSSYSGDAAFTVGDGLSDNRYISLRSASVAMLPVYINLGIKAFQSLKDFSIVVRLHDRPIPKDAVLLGG